MASKRTNIKDAIANSTIATKSKELLAKVPVNKMAEFYKTNKQDIWLTIVAITIIVVYFTVFYNRVDRYLFKMDTYDLQLGSLQENTEVIKGDFRLCDFYVASSYKSYLPCTNYYDYADCRAIKKVLECGARYIDLDVFNKDFNPCTEPVICNGDEVGNWQYTTRIPFREAMLTIAKTAFSGKWVRNPTDPLFINLNFKTWGNTDTIDKCAAIIKEIFISKLLPLDYGFQGRFSSTNIATTPITQLFDKVIICSTGEIIDTDMDEITNIHPESNANLRDITYEQVRDSYDANEITEYSRKNVTRVVPDFKGRTKQNYNFYTPFYLGCQFNCMNYTQPDEHMINYIEKFKNYSYVLKPIKLRYKPITIEQPKEQNKNVSFAPKTETTPFYSITY